MGAGFAASKRPNANQIRALNSTGQIVFSIGLYGAHSSSGRGIARRSPQDGGQS